MSCDLECKFGFLAHFAFHGGDPLLFCLALPPSLSGCLKMFHFVVRLILKIEREREWSKQVEERQLVEYESSPTHVCGNKK